MFSVVAYVAKSTFQINKQMYSEHFWLTYFLFA